MHCMVIVIIIITSTIEGLTEFLIEFPIAYCPFKRYHLSKSSVIVYISGRVACAYYRTSIRMTNWMSQHCSAEFLNIDIVSRLF